MGIAFLFFAGVLGVLAVVQGVRRWRQGDRLPLLIALGLVGVALLIWLVGVLIAPSMN